MVLGSRCHIRFAHIDANGHGYITLDEMQDYYRLPFRQPISGAMDKSHWKNGSLLPSETNSGQLYLPRPLCSGPSGHRVQLKHRTARETNSDRLREGEPTTMIEVGSFVNREELDDAGPQP